VPRAQVGHRCFVNAWVSTRDVDFDSPDLARVQHFDTKYDGCTVTVDQACSRDVPSFVDALCLCCRWNRSDTHALRQWARRIDNRNPVYQRPIKRDVNYFWRRTDNGIVWRPDAGQQMKLHRRAMAAAVG
jgi:hypothetical protein